MPSHQFAEGRALAHRGVRAKLDVVLAGEL
jgi:hypothetical protein